MRNKILFILYILFAVLAAVADVRIDYDEEAEQGRIIPVYILSDSEIHHITLTLKRNSISYGKFRGFLLDREKYHFSGNSNCHVVLLSLASDVYPDIYNLDIRWESEGYSKRNVKKITIRERNFRSEEIPLTKSLTTLRKDESERRKRETQAIIKLYRTFNSADQFDNDGFGYPLEGNFPVTSYFGDRRLFVYDDGENSKSLHNGIDYAAVKGTPVFSAGNGKVVFSGYRLITGNSIIIEHNPGFYSVYYHMDKLYAAESDIVKKGEKIGEVGSSGISTGNHLHWEVRNQGIAVDPEQLVGHPVIDKERILRHIEDSFSDIDRGR